MKSLPYTTMCIKEAMRLYPPVPYYFRDTSEDINIHGHLIPKGRDIFMKLLKSRQFQICCRLSVAIAL